MPLTRPYGQHNYLGEYANDNEVLQFIRNNKWDTLFDGTGNPHYGMMYYDTTLNTLKLYVPDYWKDMTTSVNTSNFIIGSIMTDFASLAASLNPSLAANSNDKESESTG
jgi:hypothetical protein